MLGYFVSTIVGLDLAKITDAQRLGNLRVSSDHLGVMKVRSFSANKRCINGASVRLDLAGDVRGAAVGQLAMMIVEAIVDDRPDELHVDLAEVSYLDSDGVWALLCGYTAAIEHGTFYRVINARGPVHYSLQAIGVLDVLADSEDIGALLLALLGRRRAHRN